MPFSGTKHHDDAQTVQQPVSQDKDEAIAIVGEHGHTVDPAVVARAVRKIDWFLIPAMVVGCR